jgi:hypothetical protein
LQWLALADEFGPRASAFYDLLPEYASSSKTGSIPLWSFLADCFPTTKKAEENLLSDSYRSPQMITRHLIGKPDPVDDHFVSFYLGYVYKQRELVSYDVTKDKQIKANYGSAPVRALKEERVKKDWTPQLETGKSGNAEVTRLDRDTRTGQAKAGKTEGRVIKFHGIAGQFWTRGDWQHMPVQSSAYLD